jgi:hypothetical protein
MLPHHLFALVSSTPRDVKEAEQWGLLALGALGAVLAGKYFVGLAKDDTNSKANLAKRVDDLLASNHKLELRCERVEMTLDECERHREEQAKDIRRIIDVLKLDDANADKTHDAR